MRSTLDSFGAEGDKVVMELFEFALLGTLSKLSVSTDLAGLHEEARGEDGDRTEKEGSSPSRRSKRERSTKENLRGEPILI